MDTSGVIRALARFYELDPKALDIEAVTFMGVWSATAANIVQPTPYQFEPGADHVIWGIGAFKQLTAAPSGGDNTRVEFNLTVSWQNKQIFSQNLNFGAFTTSEGHPEPIYLLPGFKKVPDRTRIVCNFAAAPVDGTYLGDDSQYGVIIYGARLNIQQQGS
jgi:hypothetical protein